MTAPPGPQTAIAEIVRVMICDDSVVIRGAMTRMLESDPSVRVTARVANGRQALEEVKRQHFDVVVLDIEMPEMDGLEALPLLLRADPGLRVVMASSLTTRGADIALRALRLGADDYLPKPSGAAIADDSFRRELLAKVVGLARLRQRSGEHRPATLTGARPASSLLPALAPAAPGGLRAAPARRPELLAIGSSTGGPQALFTFVQALGRDVPVPVVLTQHMPPTFTPMLAEHLDKLGALPCTEARNADPLLAGHLYLAPGNKHLIVEGATGALRARLSDAPPENFCRPSVDPMLRSATTACQGRVLMVMLTGMGHDGLAGTRALVEAGGTALAQDAATSVVWGMPGAIAQAGLCHKVLPLQSLAVAVLSLLRGGRA